jgi:excinuclease ABC subunit C
VDPEALARRLETLPAAPGCYLFRNKKGQVVYVGKARSLRQRVRQYFQPNTHDYRYFVPLLERVLGDVETVVTATEREAVLLENALIKEHRPRYNVRLRDDKDYLSLRLDRRAPWPRLEVVRRPRVDGAEYFGPYPNATEARRALGLVNRHFQLRTCEDAVFAGRTRPCLEYQIKRCPGPCVLPVDPEAYRAQVDYVALFLQGRSSELAERLEAGMLAASRALEFERAARLRDQRTAVNRLQETQRVAEVSDTDRDVYGLYREGDAVVVTLLLVRDGFVRDTQTTTFGRLELPDDELIAQVLSSRYGDEGATIPDEVLLPCEPEGLDGVREVLAERRGKAVTVTAAPEDNGRRLLALAQENARHAFRERRVAAAGAASHAEALGRALGLSQPPRSIECVDISHHAGDETVGALVRLTDGAPDKRGYRGYQVRSEHRGDDYRAMYEVLSRRFRRGRDGDAGWVFPDLFVVDGGRGQLNVALAVLTELKVPDLRVCALAKERESALGDKVTDRVYVPGRKNPLTLKEHGAALVLLARARDEAHRFANRLREDWHHRKRLRSALDDVPGLGPRLRAALLARFGSVDGVAEATLDALGKVPGLGAPRAHAVYLHFHPEAQLPDPRLDPTDV